MQNGFAHMCGILAVKAVNLGFLCPRESVHLLALASLSGIWNSKVIISQNYTESPLYTLFPKANLKTAPNQWHGGV
jgi:hypothetical protein